MFNFMDEQDANVTVDTIAYKTRKKKYKEIQKSWPCQCIKCSLPLKSFFGEKMSLYCHPLNLGSCTLRKQHERLTLQIIICSYKMWSYWICLSRNHPETESQKISTDLQNKIRFMERTRTDKVAHWGWDYAKIFKWQWKHKDDC